MSQFPCRNPSCNSYQTPHKNCKCYMAEGGPVGGHHCSSNNPHKPGCERESYPIGQDVGRDIGYAAYDKGLGGLLKGEKEGLSPEEGSQRHHASINRGIRGLEGATRGLLSSGRGKGGTNHERSREALKSKLEDLEENPDKLLDVGSHLQGMPDQAGVLAAHVATATAYLKSIKPVPTQPAPLDKPIPPSRVEEANYNDQLDIANDPSRVLHKMDNGSLDPGDVHTLKTLYPGLYTSMSDKLMADLVASETKKQPISYQRRQALGMFLGQPLNFTATPAAAQAIVMSQAKVAANRAAPSKGAKPTAAQLKAINKSDSMYATDSQRREQGNKS
jgi:hypothetical protein